MGYQWYVLHSKPHKEFVLQHHIHERGVESYLPSIQVQRARRKSTVPAPFFPGYLFVRADLNEVGPSFFNWMPHAVGLVNFGGIPASVSEEFISTVKQALTQGTPHPHHQPPRFATGEKVIIQNGPFEGYSAIFDSHLNGKDRVRVLLQLLNEQQIHLTLQAAQLRKSGK